MSEQDEDTALIMYQRWLLSHGVRISDCISLRSPMRKGDRRDQIPEALRKEWGLMSIERVITKGTEICSVPMEACFRGDHTLNPSVSESDDSQMHLAVPLLQAIDAGSSGMYWPKVQTLPRSVGVSWAWPDHEREWLRGTELEDVMKSKRDRLKAEHLLLQSKNIDFSYEAYFDACTVVISHANPWFGVCMVPFVDMGNHSDRPDVEFRRRANCIVGKALRSIQPWKEVYQSYGDLGVADMLYRYGFTPCGKHACKPQNDDVVSIQSQHLLSFLFSSKSNTDALRDRISPLKAAGVLCESPWYGMDDVMVIELSLQEDAEPGEVAGLADLLIAVYAFQLDEAQWQAVLREADLARQALAGKASADDIELLALYVGLEVTGSGQSQEQILTRLSPLVSSLPVKGTANEAEKQPAGSAEKGDDDSESEDEDDEEEGLSWADLIGPSAERAPWSRTARVVEGARRVLCGRDGLYPDDSGEDRGTSGADPSAESVTALTETARKSEERLQRERKEREQALQQGEAGRHRAMALQLRIVERSILAAADAALLKMGQ